MQRRRDVGHGRGKRSGMEGHGPPCMHAGLHIRQALSPAAAAVWTPPELPPPRACSRGLESCAVFLHFVRGALQGLFWAECQASCAPPGAGCLSRTLPSPAPGGCPGIAAGCRAGGTGACSVGWAGGREPEQVALGGRLSRLPHAGPALGSAPGGCALATCHAGEGGGGMTYRIRKNKRSIKGMRLKLSEMREEIKRKRQMREEGERRWGGGGAKKDGENNAFKAGARPTKLRRS